MRNSAQFASAFAQAAALHQAGRLAEAEHIYGQILKAQPRHFESRFLLGVIYAQRGSHADAVRQFDVAVKLNPKSASAHNSRGVALGKLKRVTEALASFDRAIALQPDSAEAHSNRANALRELDRPEEALASGNRAIALRPDYAEALNNRANVLLRLKRYEEAVGDLERTLRLSPDFPYVKGMLLHTKMQLCDWHAFDAEIEAVKADVRAGKPASPPFALLAESGIAHDQLLCAQAWVREKCPPAPAPLYKGERYRHDRIRIAYVSADFGEHPTSYLLAGLLEEHDRARFRILGVSLGAAAPSAMRSRVTAAFDQFLDAGRKDDREAAGLLRHLEVDIAVDLMGFTHESRPGIFALRPAPVQVNYLGFPATMGAPYIDYIIADPCVIPSETAGRYGERIAWLPDSFQANDARRSMSETLPRRTDAGLPEAGFVFCAFSNSYKITPPMFDVWMRLLRNVDGSVLWLLGSATVEQNLRREAQARGVAEERLVFRLPAALSTRRSVPRHRTVQRRRDGERRAVGGAAADHLFGRSICRANGREPAPSRRPAAARDLLNGGLRTACARVGTGPSRNRGAQGKARAKPRHLRAVRRRPIPAPSRGGISGHVGASSSRRAARELCRRRWPHL
jgi:protein O-GlcNAc transferase